MLLTLRHMEVHVWNLMFYASSHSSALNESARNVLSSSVLRAFIYTPFQQSA